jgi:hypothetical protein
MGFEVFRGHGQPAIGRIVQGFLFGALRGGIHAGGELHFGDAPHGSGILRAGLVTDFIEEVGGNLCGADRRRPVVARHLLQCRQRIGRLGARPVVVRGRELRHGFIQQISGASPRLRGAQRVLHTRAAPGDVGPFSRAGRRIRRALKTRQANRRLAPPAEVIRAAQPDEQLARRAQTNYLVIEPVPGSGFPQLGLDARRLDDGAHIDAEFTYLHQPGARVEVFAELGLLLALQCEFDGVDRDRILWRAAATCE